MNKCLYCKKEVRKKDHQVVLSTLNRPDNKKDDHQYFHFNCFVLFWNEKVNAKARLEVERMREMAFSLLSNPMIKGVVEKIGAGDQLQSMLGTSLIKTPVVHVVTKKDIEKKIKDDRKRARKTSKNPKVQ